MKVAFCSLRGAPGVTTFTLLCAVNWPTESPCVVLEADAAGGVLISRFGLESPQPNLLGLAAAARHGITPDSIYAHCRQLPDGITAVVAPTKGSEVRVALEQLAPGEIPDADIDYLIDHGRLMPGLISNTKGADLVVMLVRPVFEQLDTLLALAADLTYESMLGVVLCGKGPYSGAEVAEQLELICGDRAQLLGTLPFDPKGAVMIAAEGPDAPLTRRSRLFKAARPVTRAIADMKIHTAHPEDLLSQEILNSLQ